MVPPEVKTILDIGSFGNLYDKYKTTTIDISGSADYKIDLNKTQKLPFKNNSFDMVVMNQVLEHLVTVEGIIAEAKRVSKKYIFVGLPNELTVRARLKFLFGNPDWSGYRPYWHKHFFTIDLIEKFVKNFFGSYKKRIYWSAMRENIINEKLQKKLANRLPRLFAKEVYYLIKV